MSGECEYKCGMHINEDCFLAEIIDPDTGEVLPLGEQGELVLTTLAKEAQPAIRYRTRDITALSRSPAPADARSFAWRRSRAAATTCSSSAASMSSPRRSKACWWVSRALARITKSWVTREHFTDHLQVKVELVDASLLEKYSELEKVRDRIRAQLRPCCSWMWR